MKIKSRLAPTLALAIIACSGDRSPTESQLPVTLDPVANVTAQGKLLTLVSETGISAAQGGRLRQVRQRTWVRNVVIAQINGDPRSILRQGASIAIDLTPNKRIIATGDRVRELPSGDLVWGGKSDSGFVQLSLTKEGISASVKNRYNAYRIEPLGAGLHAIIEVGELPPLDDPRMTTGTQAGNADRASVGMQSERFNGPTSGLGIADYTEIKVLVGYTAAAASASGSISGVINNAIADANTVYANSGINLTLTLAYAAQTSYSEAGYTFAQHNGNLQSGVLSDMDSWRNSYNADIVVLLVDDSDGGTICGRANTIQAVASTAFAVLDYACADDYRYSFAHELGHLFGARHDVLQDPTSTPYQYGHGYMDPSKNFVTVMGYQQSCLPAYCPVIPYHSSPNLYYGGVVIGTSNYEDVTRVIGNYKSVVVNFRSTLASTAIAGAAQFPSSMSCTWSVSASGGTAPYTYYWSGTPGGTYTFSFYSGYYTASVTGSGNYYYPGSPHYADFPIILNIGDAEGQSIYLQKYVRLWATGWGGPTSC